MRAAIQIKSRRSAADDGEQIAFADKCHSAGTVNGTTAFGESILRVSCLAATPPTKVSGTLPSRIQCHWLGDPIS